MSTSSGEVENLSSPRFGYGNNSNNRFGIPISSPFIDRHTNNNTREEEIILELDNIEENDKECVEEGKGKTKMSIMYQFTLRFRNSKLEEEYKIYALRWIIFLNIIFFILTEFCLDVKLFHGYWVIENNVTRKPYDAYGWKPVTRKALKVISVVMNLGLILSEIVLTVVLRLIPRIRKTVLKKIHKPYMIAQILRFFAICLYGYTFVTLREYARDAVTYIGVVIVLTYSIFVPQFFFELLVFFMPSVVVSVFLIVFAVAAIDGYENYFVDSFFIVILGPALVLALSTAYYRELENRKLYLSLTELQSKKKDLFEKREITMFLVDRIFPEEFKSHLKKFVEERRSEKEPHHFENELSGGELCLMEAISPYSSPTREEFIFESPEPKERLTERYSPFHYASVPKVLFEEEYKEAAIFQCDIVNFSQHCVFYSVSELVFILNRYWCSFDAVSTEFGFIKIKTEGDAFVSVNTNPNNFGECIKYGLEILKYEKYDLPFPMRAGLCVSGCVIAVLGSSDSCCLDLFGSGSRLCQILESSSEEGRVNVDHQLYLKTRGKFKFSKNLAIENQNLGRVESYLVESPSSTKSIEKERLQRVGSTVLSVIGSDSSSLTSSTFSNDEIMSSKKNKRSKIIEFLREESALFCNTDISKYRKKFDEKKFERDFRNSVLLSLSGVSHTLLMCVFVLANHEYYDEGYANWAFVFAMMILYLFSFIMFSIWAYIFFVKNKRNVMLKAISYSTWIVVNLSFFFFIGKISSLNPSFDLPMFHVVFGRSIVCYLCYFATQSLMSYNRLISFMNIILVNGAMYCLFCMAEMSRDTYNVFLILVSIVFGIAKHYDRRQLLAIVKNSEEVLIQNRQLKIEEEKNELLLSSVVPHELMKEFIHRVRMGDIFCKEVKVGCICFIEVNNLCEDSVSNEISKLHGIFSAFDRIGKDHNVSMIKRTSNKYICVSGLKTLEPNEDICENMAYYCCDVLQKTSQAYPKIKIRVGFVEGSFCCVVIGIESFRFDIISSDVNLSSRMMSSNDEMNSIQFCGEKTFIKLTKSRDFDIVNKGIHKIKGFGELQCFKLTKRMSRRVSILN